ncbi:MAG: hypothetical protein ABI267_03430 [Ginsengibacter sp.]
MRLKFIFIILLFFIRINGVDAQLTIQAANLTVQSGATVAVQGNMSSTKDLPAMGKFLLNGTSSQSINMNGKSIPNLEIDNTSGITLAADARISNSLLFTNGKISAGNYNFSLADIATATGMGTGNFVETNGTGQVFKEISSNLSATEIPVGAGTVYRPTFLTTIGSNTGAKVGVQVLGVASVNKPPMTSDYLNTNWTITNTGINGSLNVSAEYADPSDISGTESNLKGYLFNGTDWSSAAGTVNTSTNMISFPITIASANITAMDKFDLLKAKVFLQGAYNSSTHLMSDNLRTAALIPLSDPYRTSTYSSAFKQVNDGIAETIDASVLANQLSQNDDIVDWVFLELRNTAAGNNVLQTRSALVQSDGNIVDVDGRSPVTFNNVDPGNYTIAVRHRNHLGVSTDPATFTPLLTERQSTALVVDFTTSNSLYGGSSAHGVASDGNFILWGGNANMDGKVSYTGFSNDKDYLYITTLNSNPANVITNVYSPADLNLDGKVNFNGIGNDKDFLYQTILGNSATAQMNQSLP